MKKILDKNEKALRGRAAQILASEVRGAKVRKIIIEMKAVLNREEDGVAIAAPQLGIPLRIFVVSGKVFTSPSETGGNLKKNKVKSADLVFINPEIVKWSKKKEWLEEGCLSVRSLYGKVLRTNKVRLKALDEAGKPINIGVKGLLAQIFQHEVDHLNGILFIDKAKEIHKIVPSKKEAK